MSSSSRVAFWAAVWLVEGGQPHPGALIAFPAPRGFLCGGGDGGCQRRDSRGDERAEVDDVAGWQWPAEGVEDLLAGATPVEGVLAGGGEPVACLLVECVVGEVCDVFGDDSRGGAGDRRCGDLFFGFSPLNFWIIPPIVAARISADAAGWRGG